MSIRNSRKGFTLMELLIVISLIGVIAVGLLIVLNPQAQINKAKDAKRKSDLALLKKSFEEFYNDNGRYPKPDEVCTSDNENCAICGNDPSSPAHFDPYLNHLPCDPDSPNRDYLYSIPQDEIDAPFSYRLYVTLGNLSDTAIVQSGCQGGICGPSSDYSFNYGVSSPNVDLEKNGSPSPTPTGAPQPPSSPTPSGYPNCNVDAIAKKDQFGICNTSSCSAEHMQQGVCVCTDADPCYNDFPNCSQRCILP
jgi:prepilin-type N-terminal cleavage/methylation domain-containing protein